MKKTLKILEWFWFIVIAIAGTSWMTTFGFFEKDIVGWLAIVFMLSIWMLVFWIPIFALCEFGIAVLKHFEKVESHNKWMENNQWTVLKNLQTVVENLSRLSIEDENCS